MYIYMYMYKFGEKCNLEKWECTRAGTLYYMYVLIKCMYSLLVVVRMCSTASN